MLTDTEKFLQISPTVFISIDQIELNPVRAQGPGGQNVNKVSSAIHLRFDIASSSLPEIYKQKILSSSDQRISKEGVFVMKTQTSRSQQVNKSLALQKLQEFLTQAIVFEKVRKATKPSFNAQLKRLESKRQRAHFKALRGPVKFS